MRTPNLPSKQTVTKIFVGILLFWVFLVIFSPKNQLLYKAQNTLGDANITLSVRSTTDYGVVSRASDVIFGFTSDDVLETSGANVFVGLLYTHASFSEVKITPKMKTVLPITVDKLSVSHTIFMPSIVMIDSSGSFGKMKGDIDLKNKKITLKLEPTADFAITKVFAESPLFSKFTKTDDGYRYESNF